MITEPVFYLLAIAAVLIIGISKGGFGGGMAIAGVPILSLSVDPVTAAGILLPILCCMDLMSLKGFWEQWDKALIKRMVPPVIVGILLGALTFSYFNESAIRLLLGIMTVLFTLNYWLKTSKEKSAKTPGKAASHFWSAMGGYTSFVAHAGGPPINMYMLSLRLSKTMYQGTLVLLFTIINYTKLPLYFFLGQLSAPNLMTSLTLIPLAFVGVYLGLRLHHMISEALFYRIAYIALFLTGLKLLWDGASGFN